MDPNLETIESFDDFISLVDGDSVVTPEEPEKPTVFSKPKPGDSMSFMDQEEEEDKTPGAEPKQTNEQVEDLLNKLGGSEEEEEEDPEEGSDAKPKGSRKIDKSGLVETFTKLFEEDVLIPFEEDKPLDKYTIQDFKDLIKANIEDRESQLREQTPKEFFEALPPQLQHAAKYVADGGTDLKGLFSALAQSEEVTSLDPMNPKHQDSIVREYLNATMEDRELAEEQLQEWKEAGLLGRKAEQLKPKLDKLNEKMVNQKLAQQEAVKQQMIETKKKYLENVTNTLKAGELSGVKIPAKVQKDLYDGLTNTSYQSRTGKPTTELGKLLEDYQFGEKPRYDLIAEALWILKDREGYMKTLSENFKKEYTEDTVRKLKTEEGRKSTPGAAASTPKPEAQTTKRTLKRSTNIFARG